MRYFTFLDFQYVILLAFLGVVALLLLYLAFRGYASTEADSEGAVELEEYPDGIQAGKKPIPPILVFIYVGFIIFAFAYLILVGICKGPF
jgi:hypothetical protein